MNRPNNGEMKRKRSSCQDCNEIDDDKMVCCDSCDEWSHYGCAGVGPEVEFLVWLCHFCKRFHEKNGETFVFWPSKKENFPVELENLIKKNEDIKSNWEKLKCQILMSNLDTYAKGKAAEKSVKNAQKNTEKLPNKTQKSTSGVTKIPTVDELLEENRKLRSIIKEYEAPGTDNRVQIETIESNDAIVTIGSIEVVETVIERNEAIVSNEATESVTRTTSIGVGGSEATGTDLTEVNLYVPVCAADFKFPIFEDIVLAAFHNAIDVELVLSYFESIFKKYRGGNMHETVSEICQKMLSDTLLSNYSYLGRKGKDRFKDFDNVTKLIVRATLQSLQEAKSEEVVSYKSVETYFTTEYIKHATQRKNRKNK